MLDAADKLGSVISAVLSLVVLLLTVYGLRRRHILQRAAKSATKRGLRRPDGARPGRSGTGHRDTRRLRTPRTRLAVALSALLAVGGLGAAVLLALRPADSTADPVTVGPVGPVSPVYPPAVDPCSLLDPAALEEFGPLDINLDFGGFDECRASIAPPEGTWRVNLVAEFEVPLAADQTLPGAVESLGGLKVGRLSGEHKCQRWILLTDRNHIKIVAGDSQGQSPAPVNLCEVAEAALRTAVDVLDGDRLRDRPPPAPDSLIGVDACGLLDTSALSRLEGLDPTTPSAGFGNWRCEWGDPGSGVPGVRTYFFRGNPLSTQPGLERMNIAGREAQTKPGEFDNSAVPSCLVQVAHRSFTTRTGQDRVELLRVVVYGLQPMTTLCRIAAEITATAVPKLPQPQ